MAIAAGVRAAVLTLLVVAGATFSGHIAAGTSLALGVIFVTIADFTDAYRMRARSMAWALLWLPLATLLGGIVGHTLSLYVVTAFAIAAVTGYAGALGMRGAVIGTLSLVLFAAYSGSHIGMGIAVQDAVLVTLGGALAFLVTLAPWPFGYVPGVRLSLARAFREFADACRRAGFEVTAPVIAHSLMQATTTLDHSNLSGRSREWLTSLIGNLEKARLSLLALHSLDDARTTPVLRAAGDVSGALAAGLVSRQRLRTLDARMATLNATVSACDDDRVRRIAEQLAAALGDCVALLADPWPVGRRLERARRTHTAPTALSRLREHAHLADPMTQHALRLSVAFGGASIMALLVPLSHAYWIPLTVAWISKPDLAGTVNRVTMRVLGTAIGVVTMGMAAWVFDAAGGRSLAFIIAVGVGAYLTLAYLWANYTVAVIGITVVILSLDMLAAGESALIDVPGRLIATVVAGVWVLLISLVRPHRVGGTAVDSLTATLHALGDYAGDVRGGVDAATSRAQVLRMRTLALAAVTASATEPRGLFDPPRTPIDAQAASLLLMSMVDTASLILAEELLTEPDAAAPNRWSVIDARLADEERELVAISHRR